MLKHEGDQQVALEAIVGGQGLDVALVLGVEAVKAHLTPLLVEMLSHQPGKIQHLTNRGVAEISSGLYIINKL